MGGVCGGIGDADGGWRLSRPGVVSWAAAPGRLRCMSTAFWASWSATGSAGWLEPGWNYHATQLHMPMTDSAASRSSRGRNSPLDTPSSMIVRTSARTSRRAFEVQRGYFFRERGLGAIENPEALRCSGALKYQRTDHGAQLLDRAEVGVEPDRTDDVRGVLADVPDELSAYLDQRDTATLNSFPWTPARDGQLDTAAGRAGSPLIGDGHGLP